jgi:predicted enzyme related to lactoylglutathione lyase
MSGCATVTPPVVPALSVEPDGLYQPGRFVAYDLFTADADEVGSFYGALFGWTLETSEDYGNFSLFTLDGRPVAGLVRIEDEGARSIATQWLPSLLVDNLDAAIERFVGDGRMVRAQVEVPDRGRVAVVEDAEGAPLMLLETDYGVPVGPDGAAGTFLWTELWTSDEAAALAYYESAVGFRLIGQTVPSRSTVAMMGVGDEPQAGIVQVPSDQVKPHWLSYISVEDPMEIAARAVELGGRILIEPEDTMGVSAAVLADPGGGVFGIQRWPLDSKMEDSP